MYKSKGRARERFYTVLMMDVLYIRRSLAWIHAIVFGHVSEFHHIRVKTNLEAARMCIWSYTMHLIAGI
jgi:hypothetical protein